MVTQLVKIFSAFTESTSQLPLSKKPGVTPDPKQMNQSILSHTTSPEEILILFLCLPSDVLP
jgi:hypothetical protein